MKTTELSGIALDWAVAMSLKQSGEDYTLTVDTDIDGVKRVNYGGMYPEWSTDWAEGGPIIEREWVSLWQVGHNYWKADKGGLYSAQSETPLVAAMRCYVASKLGDEIQIPEEFTDENAN
jgi:hypothetical protein